jgi:hypothetical protein
MGQLRFRDQTARALVAPLHAAKKAYHQLFRQFLVCSNKSFVFSVFQNYYFITRSDHSPPVVYLSLASGARVLTTECAQMAAPVIDNDCLVTELPFFDNSTTVSERATIMRHFLLTNDDNNCTNHTQTTRSKVYGILREELQYGPIVRQALEMWRTLNFAKEGTNNHFEDCLDLFAVECDQYRKQRGR